MTDRAPRKGTRGTYQSMTGETIGFTVNEVEGNLCYAAYDNGTTGPFIWRFRDGLNKLHDWPGKGVSNIPGGDLEVGDTIEVWWAPNRDTITALRPYTGPIKELAGARLADFALNKTGMTIEASAMFQRIAKGVA